MRPSSVFNQMRNCVDLLQAHGLTLFHNPVVVNKNATISTVTWHAPGGFAVLSAQAFCSLDEYCEFVRKQHYSAVLQDGALVQMSYEFDGEDLTSHRLCFYPCPFDLDAGELAETPLLDLIDLYASCAQSEIRLRTPIRFDYNPDNATADHSASHMHMLWSHCRCSVVAPLSVGHFIKFIFYHFYPEAWRAHPFLRELSQVTLDRTISVDQEKRLHIAWRREAGGLLDV